MWLVGFRRHINQAPWLAEMRKFSNAREFSLFPIDGPWRCVKISDDVYQPFSLSDKGRLYDTSETYFVFTYCSFSHCMINLVFHYVNEYKIYNIGWGLFHAKSDWDNPSESSWQAKSISANCTNYTSGRPCSIFIRAWQVLSGWLFFELTAN